MKKIGFIGFGNMAGAIAEGISKAKLVNNSDIYVFDVNNEAMQKAKSFKFTLCLDEIEIAKNVDMIFLCVKPQSFISVLDKLKGNINEGTVVLTIAAGITINSIAKHLGTDMPIIRAMPNTPLLLACGTTALCHNEFVNSEDFIFIKKVFSSVGTVYELNENKFNEVINVNGSTPAYIYLFAQTVAQYADESGIDYKQALDMFCDTLKGSAEMLKNSGKTPNELITMVSSKGGTTIAALDAFKSNGFTESLRAGMSACVERAKELSCLSN